MTAILASTAAAAGEFGEPILLGSLDPTMDRSFGAAVAVDGDTLAIGAPNSPEGGVVYIYQRQGSAERPWKLKRMITGVNPSTGEHFGGAVALEGETLVVGARYEGSRARASGAVYVFYRHRGGPNRWGRARILAPPNLGEDYRYGSSVAISGDRIAVGAWGGHRAWVHRRNLPIRNWWGIEAELEGRMANRLVIDQFGYDGAVSGFGSEVALSGRTLAVNAMEFEHKYGALLGLYSYGVFLFDVDGAGAWRQARHHAPPELMRSGARDYFGATLAMDGEVLVAGAAEPTRTGSHIYERNFAGRGRWGRRGELPDARGDFGRTYAVAVRGNTAAIAGHFSTDVSPFYAKGAMVYQRHRPGRNQWGAIARLIHPEIIDSPRSIAIGSREVVLGHPYPGVVQIYPRQPVVADDFESGEISGFSVAAGKLAVVSPGLAGSQHAVAVQVDGTDSSAVLRARQPERETRLSLSFHLAANRVDLARGQVQIMSFYSPTQHLVRLYLHEDPATDWYWLSLVAKDETEGWRWVGQTRIPPKRAVRLKLEWRAATGPGARDGLVRLKMDGRVAAQAQDLDTDLQVVNGMLLGLPSGSPGSAGTRGGEFLLDEIELHR